VNPKGAQPSNLLAASRQLFSSPFLGGEGGGAFPTAHCLSNQRRGDRKFMGILAQSPPGTLAVQAALSHSTITAQNFRHSSPNSTLSRCPLLFTQQPRRNSKPNLPRGLPVCSCVLCVPHCLCQLLKVEGIADQATPSPRRSRPLLSAFLQSFWSPFDLAPSQNTRILKSAPQAKYIDPCHLFNARPFHFVPI